VYHFAGEVDMMDPKEQGEETADMKHTVRPQEGCNREEAPYIWFEPI
jgi:hypothetical protein